MKNKKTLIGAIVGIGFIAVSTVACLSLPAFSKRIPEPCLPAAAEGSDTVYEFSADMPFPEETSAALYEIETGAPDELRAQVSKVIGSEVTDADREPNPDPASGEDFYFLKEEGLTVTINEKTGSWVSMKNDAPIAIPENLPTDEEVKELAEAYIVEHQLFDGELGEPKIAYSTTGSELEGGEHILRKRAVFHPTIDGIPVYGLYRIDVAVGENGKIGDVFKQASPVKAGRQVALKSKEAAMKEILEPSQTLSTSAGDLPVGRITECELAYFVDGTSVGGKAYAYPVYVFTGEGGRGDSGKSNSTETPEEFDIIIDAIQR